MKSIYKKLLFVCALLGVFTSAQAQQTYIKLEGSIRPGIRWVSSARGIAVTSSNVTVERIANYHKSAASENLTLALVVMNGCYNPKAKGQRGVYVAKKSIGSIPAYTYFSNIQMSGKRVAVPAGKFKVNLIVYGAAGVYASNCFSNPIKFSR
jgi:hypothetical protein